QDPDTMAANAFAIATAAEGRRLEASEVSSYWIRRAWQERGSVGELALHAGKKALLFWSAAEQPNVHSVEVERRWSAWLRVAPVGAWWLLAAGFAGCWIARDRSPALAVAAGGILGTMVVLAVFFPLARYRLPVVALAVPAAAAG